MHLFFKCHLSEQCWQCLGIQWPSNIDIIHLISHAKQASGNPLFMENFIIAAMVVKALPKRRLSGKAVREASPRPRLAKDGYGVRRTAEASPWRRLGGVWCQGRLR